MKGIEPGWTAEINVTPLIDVLLVLLVIFLLIPRRNIFVPVNVAPEHGSSGELASTLWCLSGLGCRPVPGPRSACDTDQKVAHNEPKLIHREQLDPGVALKLRSIQRQTDLRAGIDRQNRVEARAPDRASKIRRRPGIGEQNRAQRLHGAACAGTGRGKHDQGYEVRRRYASWTGHGASPFQEGSRHAVKPISSTEPVLGNDRTKAEGSQCA